MRVLVVTQLNSSTGYGRDGIGLVEALRRHGMDVHLSPTAVTPPLPAAVAELLTKPTTAEVDLVLVLGDPGPLPPINVRTVAWTSWPRSNTPKTVSRGWRADLTLGYDDTILGVDGDFGPRDVLHPGFWPQDWPAVTRDWHAPRISFGVLGSNGPTVLAAFRRLKKDHPDEAAHAELHIGTNTTAADPDPTLKAYVYPNTHIDSARRSFYFGQHVLIVPAPGRSQTACEFMSTGGVVIAPAAGTRQWLSDRFGYPLEAFTTDTLTDVMYRICRDRAETQRKAIIAGNVIAPMCGWDAVIERLGLLLAEHLGPPVGYTFLTRIRVARANRVGEVIRHV